MAAGLSEDIDLDISAALRDVDRLDAALEQTAKGFKVELAKATEVLRGSNGQFVAKVRVDDGGDLKRAAKDLDTIGDEAKAAEAQTKKLGGSFDGVRTAAAGALAALGTRFVVNEIGAMISAASDLEESTSKVTVVFGDQADEIQKWGDTSAEAVGLSKQAALEAAGTFGNLFTAMGATQETASQLSPDVVQLAADFASFNNLGVEETLEKLRSGLVGEIEPLRSLGVSFGAAEVEAKAMELGLVAVGEEVTEGAKLQARWALILEQSTAAQGDFARTADGLANQSRILSAELGNARAELGQRLLPVMLDAVKAGRGFLDFFLSLPAPVQNVLLGVVALGIALGPLVLAVGNISKVATAVTTTLNTLSTAVGVSTATLGVWSLAVAGIGIAYVGYTQLIKAMRDAQVAFDEELSENVNNLALASSATAEHTTTTQAQAEAVKSSAVEMFIADKAAQQLDEDMTAMAAAGAVTQRNIAQAADTLNDLAEATGVPRERIVQLANAMRINLGTATDEQKESLAAATAEISGAVEPTERLAKTQEVLGNEFATATESIDAMSEALDAALGVYLSSEQATIKVRQSVDDLAAAFVEGRKDGETLQQFQDRLTLSTHDVTDSVLDEVAALTRDGTVSAEAAAQKQAIISRLNALADTLGGPMAQELREHAFRVAAIPDEAITDVSADTSQAKSDLSGLAEFAKIKGAAIAAAFAAGIVAQFRNDEGVVIASADRIAGAIDTAARRRLQIQSPSKVAESIGGEFVDGIRLGIERNSILAEQASIAAADDLTEVWRQAATISTEEQLRIFDALDAVREAQQRLNWIRADSKSTAEQLWRAELELARAQEQVNDAVFEARDASDELADAIAAQREEQDRLNRSLDDALSTYDALSGVTGAQRSLRRAEQDLADLRAREGALPTEIAAAEQALAMARKQGTEVTARETLAIERSRERVRDAETKLKDARADATTTADELKILTLELTVANEDLVAAQAESVKSTGDVEQIERRLVDLRKEQAEIAEKVRDATEQVTEAQFALVDAQRQLIEAGEQLVGNEDELIAFFEEIARQAGLSESAIDDLTDSIRASIQAAQDAASGTAESGRSDNYRPGTGTTTQYPYGPPGTVVTRNGMQYVVDYDGQLTRVEPGGGRVTPLTPPSTRSSGGTKPAPVGGKVVNVKIEPKTVNYDLRQTAGTLRVVELLS